MANHFLRAAVCARDFARQFVEEELPDEMRFRLRLNSSYDANLERDETVYPEDTSPKRAKALRECTAETVVDTLWRDGTVPEWADLQVLGRTEQATLVQVMVCGRFTANNRHLYHVHEGYPPFHVTGPCLPVGWEEGRRFSIYDRSECWNERDLDLLRPHTANVWSLELHGSDVNDVLLERMPTFPKLEILELQDTHVSGSGLASLHRLPNLRVLRVHLERGRPFDVSSLPELENLTTLDFNGLPAKEWGFACLHEKAPNLKRLTLNAWKTLYAKGRCPAAEEISLGGKRLRGIPQLPERAEQISFHFHEFSDELCNELLKPVNVLHGLGLRGSPVSAAQIESIIRRFGLRYLDAFDCGLTKKDARRIAAAFPDIRMFPNYATNKGNSDPDNQ